MPEVNFMGDSFPQPSFFVFFVFENVVIDIIKHLLCQCFRHSDLHQGRPSTSQFREKLPWFLNALPSADCAKGGHGAYTTSLDLNGMRLFYNLNVNPALCFTTVSLVQIPLFSGYESGVIQASEFRTYHMPLNKQVY